MQLQSSRNCTSSLARQCGIPHNTQRPWHSSIENLQKAVFEEGILSETCFTTKTWGNLYGSYEKLWALDNADLQDAAFQDSTQDALSCTGNPLAQAHISERQPGAATCDLA